MLVRNYSEMRELRIFESNYSADRTVFERGMAPNRRDPGELVRKTRCSRRSGREDRGKKKRPGERKDGGSWLPFVFAAALGPQHAISILHILRIGCIRTTTTRFRMHENVCVEEFTKDVL